MIGNGFILLEGLSSFVVVVVFFVFFVFVRVLI